MRWDKRLKWNRVAKVAILVCLIVSVVFAGFTVYGANVGNFVISVEDEGTLAVTIDEDPFADGAELTTRLNVNSLDSQTNITLSDIPEDIASGMGSKNYDGRYLAYSFNLVNVSDVAADYTATVYINECFNDADEIVRFMLLKGDETTEHGDIYGRANDKYVYTDSTGNFVYYEDEVTVKEENGITEYYYEDTPLTYISSSDYVEQQAGYTQIDFIDESTVLEFEDQLSAYGYTKYTIVLWLEGWDVECTNEKYGGTIKMEMNFTQIFE